MFGAKRNILLWAMFQLAVAAQIFAGPLPFRRGDANSDGRVDVADAAYLINFTLIAGAPPQCVDSGDVNDDGNITPDDAFATLNFLASGGPIDAPGPDNCGVDPTVDFLNCVSYPVDCVSPPPPEDGAPWTLSIEAPKTVTGNAGDLVRFPATVFLEADFPVQAWSLSVRSTCEVFATSIEGTAAASVPKGFQLKGFHQAQIFPDNDGFTSVTLLSTVKIIELPPGYHPILDTEIRATVPPDGCDECALTFDDRVGGDVKNVVSPLGQAAKPRSIRATIDVCTGATPLPIGVPLNRSFTNANSREVFVLGAPDPDEIGTALVLTTTPGEDGAEDENFIYARYGRWPTPSVFDFAADARDRAAQRLAVPRDRDEDLYVLVGGNVFPAGIGDMVLRADTAGHAIESIVPSRSGVGDVRTIIRGASFPPTASYALENPNTGDVIAGSLRRGFSPNYVEVDFNIAPGTPAGLYDVVVTIGAVTERLGTSFEVVDRPATGRLEAEISVPPRYRFDRIRRISLRYRNVGDGEMIAPLLKISGPPESRFRLEGDSEFQNDELLVLATNFVGPTGILSPGATVEVPIEFRTRSLGDVEFTVSELQDPGGTALDWSTAPRPAGIPESVWDNIVASMETQLGSTWSDFAEALADRSGVLAPRGLSRYSALEAFRYAARQAHGRPSSAALGTLVEPDGEPIADHPVFAMTAGAIHSSAMTDEEGSFSIDWLEPGDTYTIVARNREGDLDIVATSTDAVGIEIR
ncbi:MAG: dockerin type I domain-containing protein, partial [Planctomycetota bacterium]